MAKGHCWPPEARKSKEPYHPPELLEGTHVPIPWLYPSEPELQTSGLCNCKRKQLCCFQPLNLWYLFTAAAMRNYPRSFIGQCSPYYLHALLTWQKSAFVVNFHLILVAYLCFSLFILIFFVMRFQFPDQGLNLCPLQWKHTGGEHGVLESNAIFSRMHQQQVTGYRGRGESCLAAAQTDGLSLTQSPFPKSECPPLR